MYLEKEREIIFKIKSHTHGYMLICCVIVKQHIINKISNTIQIFVYI